MSLCGPLRTDGPPPPISYASVGRLIRILWDLMFSRAGMPSRAYPVGVRGWTPRTDDGAAVSGRFFVDGAQLVAGGAARTPRVPHQCDYVGRAIGWVRSFWRTIASVLAAD